MKTYNGGSISNVIKNINLGEIYVTDCAERAIRYANAQATEEVNPAMDQELAENGIILEIEVENEPNWLRRTNGGSLDSCEAVVRQFVITKATVRFLSNERTVYGTRWTGYKNSQQVVEFLQTRGIEVKII